MQFDTIQVQQSVTSTVTADGGADEEIARTAPRYSCTDSRCGLGFAEWDDVVEHCGIYHRGPDDSPPAPAAPDAPVVEAPVVDSPAVVG